MKRFSRGLADRSRDAGERQQFSLAHFDARAAPAKRLQPMCNAHNGGVNELLLKNLLEMLFSLLVEGRCGFVQKEHGGFFEKHASETNLRQA